jgi:hypothetical protein
MRVVTAKDLAAKTGRHKTTMRRALGRWGSEVGKHTLLAGAGGPQKRVVLSPQDAEEFLICAMIRGEGASPGTSAPPLAEVPKGPATGELRSIVPVRRKPDGRGPPSPSARGNPEGVSPWVSAKAA